MIFFQKIIDLFDFLYFFNILCQNRYFEVRDQIGILT